MGREVKVERCVCVRERGKGGGRESGRYVRGVWEKEARERREERFRDERGGRKERRERGEMDDKGWVER
jgi:hypothetical protein